MNLARPCEKQAQLSGDSGTPASAVCQREAGVSHATQFAFHPRRMLVVPPPALLSVPAGSPLLAHPGSREPVQMFSWTKQKPFLSAKTHTGLFAGANVSVASKAMWFWSSSNLI